MQGMALALGPRVSLALVMICAALSDASPAPAAAPEPRGAAAAQVLVAVPDWSAGPLTPSTPTYQTSVNPKYRVDGRPGASNISAKVFANMAALGADHVRHVPWFPYPHLAVAELQEPGTRGGRCQTHWNWTLIDPITQALMKAVGDHPVVLNFATTPDWMWARGSHPYPPDPNRQDMGYNAGTVLRDSSLQEVTLTQPSPNPHPTLTQPSPNPHPTLTQPSPNPHPTLTTGGGLLPPAGLPLH